MDLKAPDLVRERAADPAAFAIGGVAPARATRPRDRDELVEIVRAAARDGLALVPWGGGTALARDVAPEHYDLALDLRALDRIVEYEPADVTITAECGATLAALRALTAGRDAGATRAARADAARAAAAPTTATTPMEFPLECPHAEQATLGGVLACNASGPRRLRFGGPRDRILGARYVLGDGTLVRTGGKVVKNVAGYGIHRMLCGSRGGLAILVDASLKLLPAPAARAALVYRLADDALLDAARWSPIARFEPAALTAVDGATAAGAGLPGASPGSTPGASWVVIGLEDDPPRIDQCRDAIEAAFGAPALVLGGEDVEALWQTLCDLADAFAPRLTFTSAHLTPAALAPLRQPSTPAAVRGWMLHAACGRLHVAAAGDPAGAGLVAALATAGFTLIEAGQTRGAPGGPGASVMPAIPAGAAVQALRSRIREALDPGGRMAYGSRWEREGG